MNNPIAFLAPALIVLSLASAPSYASAHGSCHGASTPGMGILSPRIHDKLQLTPEQEKTWQDIAASAKTLRTQNHDAQVKLKEALQQELAKQEPDLAKIGALKDTQRAQNQEAWKAIETQQLNFYASLSTQQKAVVKEALVGRMKHMDERHKG